MVFSTQDILAQFDACAQDYTFPMLDNAYIFPAATRMSLYRGQKDWAMLIQVLGFGPGVGGDVECMFLDVYGFGSCLKADPGLLTVLYPLTPGTSSPLFADSSPGYVRDDAVDICIRGHLVPLVKDPDIYATRGIDLVSPQFILGFELLRLLALDYGDMLLATRAELADLLLPVDGLRCILQLEEWHHPDLADDELPGHTRTFKMLAEVLVNNDVACYSPGAAGESPNTHWHNWPYAGGGPFCDWCK